MARRFKQLTKADRLKIEALDKAGHKVKEIAEQIGVHQSTIYRELKRGRYIHTNSDLTEEERYSPDIAHEKYQENLRAKGPDLKIGNDQSLADFIEDKMVNDDFSVGAVLGYIEQQYMCRINAKRGAFIKKITKFYFDFHWQWEHIVGCVINDPLAVAYFIDPSICEGFESFVQIETEGISLGQSVVDSMNFYRKEPNAKVLTQVDTYRFFEMMLSRVLEVEPESLDILENVL